MTEKIRRSFLYAPSDKFELMKKTAETDADAVVFDLEDAVPRDKKEAARNNLREIRDEVELGRMELCVRVNGIETDFWLEDLRAAIEADADIIKLPMIEHSNQLKTFISTSSQLTSDLPEFFITLESPLGIFSGPRISSAAKELSTVTGISFGIGDYSRIIGAPELNYHVEKHLSELVTGYAAMGDLDSLYTVYTNVNNIEELKKRAKRAYELGYTGQAAIHPDQVSAINDIYTPNKELVKEAKRLVKKYNKVDTDSIVIDGIFLDTAIVERYNTIIDRYENIRSIE